MPLREGGALALYLSLPFTFTVTVYSYRYTLRYIYRHRYICRYRSRYRCTRTVTFPVPVTVHKACTRSRAPLHLPLPSRYPSTLHILQVAEPPVCEGLLVNLFFLVHFNGI